MPVTLVPLVVLAAPLCACGSTTISNCASPEWTQQAVFEMPPLRPRDALELHTEIVASDSTCPGVETTFRYTQPTLSSAVQSEVRKRALGHGWQVDLSTDCLTRTFENTVTVLSTERQSKKMFTIYADEASVGQSCGEEGFAR